MFGVQESFKTFKEELSPREVAKALGVSESAVKRWCDDGLLPFERTPGGHRRVPSHAVLRFAREHGRGIRDGSVLAAAAAPPKPAGAARAALL
ncbi:MAG: helix-turn-helix domain-containing protein [Myxococcales bacterium]|nr:helix-turn-helix domain-containing protein [Myxococcales bacterium]